MSILSVIAWVLATLFTFAWIAMIRDTCRRGNGVTPEVINTGMLFCALLGAVPLLGLPGLHFLWLFPLAWFLGQRSGRFPLSLLDYPGRYFFLIVTRGVSPQ